MLALHDNWPTRLRFARLMLAANLQRLSALLADFVLEMFGASVAKHGRAELGEGEAFTGNW